LSFETKRSNLSHGDSTGSGHVWVEVSCCATEDEVSSRVRLPRLHQTEIALDGLFQDILFPIKDLGLMFTWVRIATPKKREAKQNQTTSLAFEAMATEPSALCLIGNPPC